MIVILRTGHYVDYLQGLCVCMCPRTRVCGVMHMFSSAVVGETSRTGPQVVDLKFWAASAERLQEGRSTGFVRGG